MIKQFLVAALAAASFSTAAFAQGTTLAEGKKMVQYERHATAEKILQPLAASDPVANYYLGLSKLGQDDLEGARAIFNKYPQDAANMAGMARIAFLQKNTAEGLRIATAVADMAKKKDAMPLVWAADALTYAGTAAEAQQAINWYTKALEKTDNVDIRIGLGQAYEKLPGGGGQGMTNYEKAIGMDAASSLGHSRIGALWYAARQYDTALAYYQRAKDADPANPIPYDDLANAYYRINRMSRALENIQQYYELSDKTPDDKIRLANITFLAKQYGKADTLLNELLQSGVQKPYMYRLLGYSQYENKNYTGAMQNMQTFFQRQTDPNKIIATDWLYMGRIYASQKQTDSAIANFNRALVMDTTWASRYEVYKSVGESYVAQKNDTAYRNAAEWYGRVLKESPKPTATDYYNAGLWTYYGKDYLNAARIFTEMEQKFPEQPSATYFRGRVAAAQDSKAERGEAVESYTKWLSIPDDDKYTHKKPDLMQAYQYLTLYYYNKKDTANTNKYLDLMAAIEPENAFVKQVRGLLKGAK